MEHTPLVSLKGKVAVVTGAAGGLGTAMSLAMARAGAIVVGVDVNANALTRLGAALSHVAKGRDFLPVMADVGSADAATSVVEQAINAFGSVDVVVNNAGLAPRDSQRNGAPAPFRFWEATIDGYQRTFATSALGPFYLSRAAVPKMLVRKWGRIVNITTSYDTMVRGGGSAYGPAKAALEASTSVWAHDLAGTGVTVNVLVPGGATRTGMIAPHLMERDGLLSPDVMMAPICWLASDQSDGVTGCRFTAEDWDPSAPLEEAALRARTQAGWHSYAEAATDRRRQLGR